MCLEARSTRRSNVEERLLVPPPRPSTAKSSAWLLARNCATDGCRLSPVEASTGQQQYQRGKYTLYHLITLGYLHLAIQSTLNHQIELKDKNRLHRWMKVDRVAKVQLSKKHFGCNLFQLLNKMLIRYYALLKIDIKMGIFDRFCNFRIFRVAGPGS